MLCALALNRGLKRLYTIISDLEEARKGMRVAFDQHEDSSFEFDLDQPATQPSSWMLSDIGPLDRQEEILKDPIMAFSRLFPEDYLEEKSEESFGILGEEICHFLARVSLGSVSLYPFLPNVLIDYIRDP